MKTANSAPQPAPKGLVKLTPAQAQNVQGGLKMTFSLGDSSSGWVSLTTKSVGVGFSMSF